MEMGIYKVTSEHIAEIDLGEGLNIEDNLTGSSPMRYEINTTVLANLREKEALSPESLEKLEAEVAKSEHGIIEITIS